MEYLCLIYENESLTETLPAYKNGEIFAEYKQFSADVAKSGKLRGGNALQPVASATTVRVRDGKTLTTDGPFAETREQLGGYYLIEAENLDEALKIAAKIPSAKVGSIEVRPIMVFEG